MSTITSLAEASERTTPATDQLYYAVRGTDGRWPGRLGLIDGDLADGPAGIVGASLVEVRGELTLVAVGTDGELYETTLAGDSSWQPFRPVRCSGVPGRPVDFYAASCGVAGGALHLVGHGSDGRLYHMVRDTDGIWQERLEPIDAQVYCGPAGFASSACAGVGGSLHVIALDAGGQLYHTVRRPDGWWEEFRGLMRGQLHDAPPRFAAVDCAAVGGSLHVVGVGCDGRLYHTLRGQDGVWQRYFGVLGGQRQGEALRFVLSVGCARVGGALEVIAICSDHRLFHSMRASDGSWHESPRFIDTLTLGGQPELYEVSCASTGGGLHLVCGTWQGGFA